MIEPQLSLTPTAEPPEHRVKALAGVLAGFRYPDRGSFEALTQPQKRAVLATARSTLIALAEGPE